MTKYVVDASIVAKWFFPEEYSETCLQLVSSKNRLFAPDLIWNEVGNVIWKRVRRGEISVEEATRLIDDLLQMPLETQTSRDLMSIAIQISLSVGITVYDASYLALAMTHQFKMVTADEKLVRVLTGTNFETYLQPLTELH